MTSSGWSFPGAAVPVRSSLTLTPFGDGDDVVPEAAQRDGGRDLLRDRHLLQVGATHGGVVRAGRDDEIRRHERRARADEREQRLEHVRAALEHVDEVDPAGAGRRMPSLHADERRHRMRLVGQEDVVVRRYEVEDDAGDDEQADEHAGDARRSAEPLHQKSARWRPPSTTIVWPVT